MNSPFAPLYQRGEWTSDLGPRSSARDDPDSRHRSGRGPRSEHRRPRSLQLVVDVGLLAQLLDPGPGGLVELAAAKVAADLLFHLRERLEVGLLDVGDVEYVDAV